MRYTLLEHSHTYYPRQESETFKDRWYAGDVYANRHQAMAKLSPHKSKGHLFIAKIESMPVIGYIAACLEYLAVRLFAERGEKEKLRRNLQEAINDHKDDNTLSFSEISSVSPAKNITVIATIASHKGKKRVMEDRLKCYPQDNGNFSAAVFDGHVGPKVAQHATVFDWKVPEDLSRIRIRRVFKALQEEIKQEKTSNAEGATGGVVHIKGKEGMAFIATLGDTNTFIYRKVKGEVKIIPLSPKRDWSHKKELARALSIDPDYIPNPEEVKPRFQGMNASRSLGDAGAVDDKGRSFTSHMPKVTEVALQVDDIIVVASDGLWDFKTHKEIVEALNPASENIAEDILNTLALLNKTPDNVAIIAMKVIPFNSP